MVRSAIWNIRISSSDFSIDEKDEIATSFDQNQVHFLAMMDF